MSSSLHTILVTGATGFLGLHLCQHLLDQGYRVKAVGRQPVYPLTHENLSYHPIENIDGKTDWQDLLDDVAVIVHLAARVHHMKDRKMKALSAYQEVNVRGTQQLVRQAVKGNVKRFIYVSSIKVNGEQTFEMPFRAEDHPQPQDAYSLSKLQGEQILKEEARRQGMEWVIIRPPLIYGPKVKGNFQQLIALAKTPYPLPFRLLKNQRSLVSVFNLVSFIECCLHHQNAHREIFLVSDNQDLSTSQLLLALRKALGRGGRLFPFPLFVLKLFGLLTGKRRQVGRITESLQVNIEKSTRLLNWLPPVTVEEALKMTVAESLK
ncbi:NAD-dependent epimerase/dehydratase family protein [Candidatus Berkiella aquae]|uniref:3 beta-hydroxysteroid dehydrogenase/Delta 5-->4-isomerase n=1 Tax=Candidatus Berkiella aquae TaxID=295108 RepID=A0A0Q9YI44_9GAMM|nr:NAD-dependent epimerase/dehydratase family protein [Candidatus Berkiella aquae]MCS5712286.1 NAD-dependent epimerase/dehydratase family protein [Candidatus Berkiella aquae]